MKVRLFDLSSPPAKEGNERSEGVVVLWSSKVISMRLPKNNHPVVFDASPPSQEGIQLFPVNLPSQIITNV